MSLEDKLNQVKGSVKEGLGKVTGDTKTEAEGVAEKVASKMCIRDSSCSDQTEA